jgi:eukaryotic translation initiation factor 2C
LAPLADREFITPGLRVEVLHRGAQRRKFRVCGVTRLGADKLTFPDDETGAEVSVAEYFKGAYANLRYPQLPCLHVGSPKKHVYLPMEVCKLPGQKRLQKMTDQMTADMCAKTCTRPTDRQVRKTPSWPRSLGQLQPFLAVYPQECAGQLACCIFRANLTPFSLQRRITERAKLNNYSEDPFLAAFRVQCSPQLVQVTGRILEPPKVQYGDSGVNRQIQPRLGVWNMVDTHLHTSRPLRAWAVVNLGRSRDDQVRKTPS